MTGEREDGGGYGVPRAESPTERESAFNAPWPPLALAASFLALYGLQSLAGPQDGFFNQYGFSPADLAQGRPAGLLTSLFVHGGWAHAFLNALGAVAFGAPTARLFGVRVRGVVAFFAFFLVCGVLSGLVFAAFNWDQSFLLVGASGGVSGLMAAASRLIERRGRLAPFLSRTVIGMSVAWLVVNLLVAAVGLSALTGGAPIAWQAHLAGFAAGLVLAGPFARLGRGGAVADD